MSHSLHSTCHHNTTQYYYHVAQPHSIHPIVPHNVNIKSYREATVNSNTSQYHNPTNTIPTRYNILSPQHQTVSTENHNNITAPQINITSRPHHFHANIIPPTCQQYTVPHNHRHNIMPISHTTNTNVIQRKPTQTLKPHNTNTTNTTSHNTKTTKHKNDKSPKPHNT